MQASRILRYTGIGLLLAVLVTGPFFQGLFFWKELLAAILAISIGFLLWLLGRRVGGLPSGIPGGVAGVALLALLGCYLLQFAWAVFPRGNIDGVLRVAAAWMAYVMMRAESGPTLRRWLGWLFVLSASAVAVLGFLEYTGYLLANPALAEALSIVGLQTRMFTVFQYPNTAAVYFLAAMFVLSGLTLAELRPWITAAAGGLLALLGLAFFFTISRGAVLMLPFGLVLFYLGLDRKKLWPALLLLGVAVVPVVATMKGVGITVADRNWIGAFGWIGLAMAAGLGGGLALAYFLRLRGRVQAALAAVALVLATVGLTALRPADGFLPKQAARLLDINLRTPNVVLRLTFAQDALELVANHPLGLGGWGWDRAYRQVQEFDYTARETHNHYAQTAVEAGVPGAVALLVALAAAIWIAWKGRGTDPLAWSLAAGAGLIAGHSVIDFNLSFGVVWLVLWSLLGAGATPAKPITRLEAGFRWTGAGAAAVVAGFAGVLLVGAIYTNEAERLQTAKQLPEAKKAAQQAARYDRWDSHPLLIIGDQEALERAVQMDSHDHQPHFDLAILLERQGDYPGALREVKAALKAYPMAPLLWDKAASVTGKMMVDALHNGELEQARALANDLVRLGNEFMERKSGAERHRSVVRLPKMEMGSDFRLRYGQALYLQGQVEEAEGYLAEASMVGLLGSESDVWLYAMYERRGDKAKLDALATKPWIRFREQNPVYNALREWDS